MAIPVTVPRLGWSMEEGTFAGWLKADGDAVRPGEALFALESDKATENVEAIDAGILRLPADGPRPGDVVQVGQVLAHLMAADEAAATEVAAVPVAGPAVRQLARRLGVELQRVAGGGPGGRIREDDVRQASSAPIVPRSGHAPVRRAVTPRARRLARQLGVDATALAGSGRNSRVRERDVRAASLAGGTRIPHTPTRRTIAARMVAGVTVAAPVTLTTRADATHLVGLREQFKAAATGDEPVPGYTDFFVRLTALALRRHPRLQAQWHDDGLFVPDAVHLALAVDSDAGLLVPVIRDADRLSLRQTTAVSRDLVQQARQGRLSGEQMRGATFTISNLGMYGIDAFTPILHLPQSAVLGIGRIVREPAVVAGAVVPREQVRLSLTFDHRVLDGGPAARFLDALRQMIEAPAAWLIS